MDEIRSVLEACTRHGLHCERCRESALEILEQSGLQRAVGFVHLQRPHGKRRRASNGPNALRAAGADRS